MDIAAFIERFQVGLASLETLPIIKARARYEALCHSFAPPDPMGMTVVDEQVAGSRVRRFRPAVRHTGTVVFIHGGGFTLGSVKSHHGIAMDLAKRLEREVISIDYPLAPEARYGDMLACCYHVMTRVGPFALVGDSAGARLALECAAWLSQPPLLGLIYPPVNGLTRQTLGNDAPLLSRQDVLGLTLLCPALGSCAPTPRPACSMEILSVEHDPLTAPLEHVVDEWRLEGGDVGYRVAPDMVHAALHAHAWLPEMQDAWQDFCQALTYRLNARYS
ncbi:alpha/beta hydrolase [Vreelandella sp. EE22]